MRMGMNVGGDVLGVPTSPLQIVEQLERAETDGFDSAWSVHFSRAYDALTVLAVSGARTSTIEVGVGIVPTYPRHPLALAQQAATAQVFCGGRLTLGVGVSHRPVIEELHGLRYDSPAAHMRDYLSVLLPLLRDGSVTHHGEFYDVDGGFGVVDAAPVPVVVGALSPKMVRVAGELADGIVTWLAGPRSLSETIVPALAEATAGRAAPRIIAALPVAVSHDADAARAQAEESFGRYNGMRNYQRLFEREHVASVADLAVIGTEAGVETTLNGFAAVGVTEIWAVPFGDEQQVRRSRELLSALAAG